MIILLLNKKKTVLTIICVLLEIEISVGKKWK